MSKDESTYDLLNSSQSAREFARQMRAAQDQELELARIGANRDVELANIASRQAEKRRGFLGGLLVAFACFVLAAMALGAIAYHGLDLGRSEQDKARQAELAKVCIQADRNWVGEQCRD